MHRRPLLLAGAATALAHSLPAAAAAAEIRGSATYRERMALPPGAELEVVLEDIARVDAPATRIAALRIPIQGQVPIPFALSYDPGRLDPRARLALRATISQGGQVMFRTDRVHPVTPGADAPVTLLLVRSAGHAGAGPAAAPGLVGPRWVATAIEGLAVAPGIVSDITFAADGAAHGSGGCNRLRGGYRLEGPAGIAIGPLASTMMACPPPKAEQERRFVAALEAARRWQVEDGALLLLDAAGRPVLRLTAG